MQHLVRESAIPRGALGSTQIEEHWGFVAGARALPFSGGGRIGVETDFDGRTLTLKPKVDDDWLDTGVIEPVVVQSTTAVTATGPSSAWTRRRS